MQKYNPPSNNDSTPDTHETYWSDYNQIADGLFIGNDQTARDLHSLKLMNITHILVAGGELAVCHPQHFAYLKLQLVDSLSQNIAKHFEQAAKFIRQGIQSGGVLVHCKYGISRSSTLVIAYFMLQHGMTMQQAFGKVRQKRCTIQPNTEFMRQLREFEKRLSKKL